MKANENIDWTLLEPRDAKGEAAGIGRWQGHTYVCHRLGDGSFAATHQYRGGEPTLLKTGVTGHRAWRVARGARPLHRAAAPHRLSQSRQRGHRDGAGRDETRGVNREALSSTTCRGASRSTRSPTRTARST
jgi:hypothetical protein